MSGLASLDGSGKVPSTQLALAASDIPNLDAAKITSGTITQNVSATSVAGTTGTFTNLRIYDGTANFLTQTAPAGGFAANYTVQWPSGIGSSGQVLQISSVAGSVATLGWVSQTASLSGSTSGATAYSTFLGVNAGTGLTSGTYNTFVGYSAGVVNSTGGYNTAVGAGAMKLSTSGEWNVAVGSNALTSNSSGGANVAVGDWALKSNTTGTNNTVVGQFAGSSNLVGDQNVYLGQGAGGSSTGSGNVFIGNQAGANELGSNKLYIANTNTATPLISGDFSSGFLGIATGAPNTALDVNGAFSQRGMAAPAVSVAGQGRMYFDSTSNTFKMSKNAGAYGDIAFGNCALNEVLKWNGTTWACAADATGGAPGDASYAAKGIVQFLTDAATSGITVASGVANVNMGTGANQVVQLTAASKYPAVDGSLITNIAAGNITGVLPIANGGTNSSTALNSNRLMASVGGAIVETAAMTDGQFIVGKTGSAPQLVTMSGDATVSNLGAITLATVPVTKGGTATTSYGNNKVIVSNGTGSALVGASCALNQVISFDAGGSITCANVADLSSAFQNGGNSFGANATLGTNDDYTLGFKTNNSVAMTILGGGNVGIGTTSPNWLLDIQGTSALGQFKRMSGAAGQPPGFLFTRTRGTPGSEADIVAGDQLGKVQFRARTGATELDFGGLVYVADSTTAGQGHFGFTKADLTTEVVSIFSNTGKVGIGTTSPSLKLDTRGSSAKATTAVQEDIFQVASTDAASPLALQMGLKTDTTANNRYGSIEVDEGGTARDLRLQQAGGNVVIGDIGIGSGWSKVHLHGGGGVQQTITASGNNEASIVFSKDFGSTYGAIGVQGTDASLRFSASSASVSGAGTQMVLTDLGKVGIGTTGPGSTLDVKGTFRISGATSGAVEFAVPAAAGSASYTWPAAAPASNKVLQSDSSGVLSWVPAGTGDALTTNPLSQFAATTSAQLAGVLSDESGTGAAVFAASPTLSGTPLASTAAVDTNTTQISTTAFVVGQAVSTGPVMDGTQAVGTSLQYARADHVHASDTSRAPAAGSSNIVTLGTITTGIWNGTLIPVLYGGTGTATGSITGTGALTFTAGGANSDFQRGHSDRRQ